MTLYLILLGVAFLTCAVLFFFDHSLKFEGKLISTLLATGISAIALFLILLPVNLIGSNLNAETVAVNDYPIAPIFENHYVWYTKDKYIVATPNKTFNIPEDDTIITYVEGEVPTLIVYTIGLQEDDKWWLMDFFGESYKYEFVIPPNSIKFLPS